MVWCIPVYLELLQKRKKFLRKKLLLISRFLLVFWHARLQGVLPNWHEVEFFEKLLSAFNNKKINEQKMDENATIGQIISLSAQNCAQFEFVPL